MKYFIVTGTVTYAMRGRDMLKNKGFKASIERSASGFKSDGCGYGIRVSGNIDEIKSLLLSGGIKIKRIEELPER